MDLNEESVSAASALDGKSEVDDALELSFQPEVSDSLFSTRGSVLLKSGGGMPYLMFNATLMQGSVPLDYISYMMIDVEPGRSRSFEISLNRRIDPGLNYTCHLDVSGPGGVLASESRECRLVGSARSDDTGVAISREDLRKLELEYIKFGQSLAEASEDESTASKEESESRSSERSTSIRVEDESEGPVQAAPEKSEYEGSSNSSFKPDVALALIEEASEAEGNGSEGAEFVGSISSKKYHSLNCRYAIKIKEEKRIYFQSAEDAKDQEYEPCKVCNPG